MTKAEFDYPDNILRIAAALGTPDQAKTKMTDEQISELLVSACAQWQAERLMNEAFKLAIVGNKRLSKKVNKIFNERCRHHGIKR